MTGVNTDKGDRQKVYELWWEYLKRSEGYKSFCERYPDAVSFDHNPLLTPCWAWNHPYEDDEDFLTEYRKWACAICFGNVHQVSFKEWWERFKSLPREEPVEVLSPDVVSGLLSVIWDWDGNDMSMQSLSEAFVDHIERPELPYVYIRINADDYTLDDIKKIEKIIKGKKKSFKARRDRKRLGHVTWYFRKPYFKPGLECRVRYDELKRYLAIYDKRMLDKMKWRDIHEKIYPKQAWAETARRSIKKEYDKAVEIIANVERGEFPGTKYYM